MKSQLETKFALLWRAVQGPVLAREFKFHPERKWRFDFADPLRMVAVELEGGVWSGGRHTRGSGFIADCDKYNAATVLGWRIFRLTSSHLNFDQVGAIAGFLRNQPTDQH